MRLSITFVLMFFCSLFAEVNAVEISSGEAKLICGILAYAFAMDIIESLK